MVEMSLVR